MAFKLKSGNKPSFKMMGSKPYKKALVGDQHELPNHLKQEILNSPAKQKIVGEDTSEIKKDAKGKDYTLALYDTESGVMKGDTIRPGNAPRVGDYIMGGDYDLEKIGEKNFKIKPSSMKQKVYGGPDSDSDDPKEQQRERERIASLMTPEMKAAAKKGAEALYKHISGSKGRKGGEISPTDIKKMVEYAPIIGGMEDAKSSRKGSGSMAKQKYDVETAHDIETAGGGKSDHITFRNKKGKSVDYQQHTDADGNMTTYKTKYSNKRGKDGSYQTRRRTISNKRGERQIRRKLNKS